MTHPIKLLLCIFCWLIASATIQADDQPGCYLLVENPDKIEPKIVESLSISLLSKYIEVIRAIPGAGISQDACVYQVGLKKSIDTLLITISGRNLNGIGDSKLKGFDGVQQAFLKAIFHGKEEKRGELCRDFAVKLESACDKVTATTTHRRPQLAKVVLPPRSTNGISKGLCSYPEPNKDFRHCDLERKKFRGRDLSGAIFSGVNLERADFSGCELTGTDFKGADLERALFDGANIVDSDFSSANLTRATFRKTNISNVSFAKTKFERAKFTKAILHQVNLSGANLENAEFKGATLKIIDFSSANLEDAKFKNANLVGVNLKGADLEDVDFSKATLADIIR